MACATPLEITKEFAETAQAILASLAIVVGAIWFFLTRKRYPAASVAHQVWPMPLDDGRLLLHVQTTISNVGQRLIRLPSALTRLYQVQPLDGRLTDLLHGSGDLVAPGDREVAWPTLAKRDDCFEKKRQPEIEPGESEVIECDFIIDDPAVEIVEVYSHFPNRKKKGGIGWGLTTIVNLREGAGLMPEKPVPPKPQVIKPATPSEIRQVPPKVATPPPTLIPAPSVGGQRPAKPATPPPSKTAPKK